MQTKKENTKSFITGSTADIQTFFLEDIKNKRDSLRKKKEEVLKSKDVNWQKLSEFVIRR
jgi:hypothetical protein